MKFNPLGSSGLSISEVCLGTMTWGIQNTQSEADEQIAMALGMGVNAIDTAEMYPVPPNQQTYGDTERILGNWLARNQAKRGDVIVMSKIAGPGLSYIRNGSAMTQEAIPVAIEDSLERLNTDYIDVYQLHWPNRNTAHFAKHWPWRTDPTTVNVDEQTGIMAGIVTALGKAIEQGKIRHWGLSDETPWGIHTFLRLCDELSVPRPVSIQNEFSLIHQKDWPYVIETCVLENVAYLPWSPLGTGVLTGKYLNGARPKGSRWTLEQRQGLFRDTRNTHIAVQAYVDLAKEYEISPAHLALKWVQQVNGVTSTIIGATSCVQLQENIQAFELDVPEEVLDEVQRIIKRYPAPF